MIVVLAFNVAACTKTPSDPEHHSSSATQTESATSAEAPRCAPDVAALPERVQRGVCLAHNYQAGGRKGYGTKTSAGTLRELAELGATWVSLTPFGFMRALDDPVVHSIEDYPAGETDARVRREIKEAKSLGFGILLKPHLWIANGLWRGKVAFDSDEAWQAWFESYERWILHYAELAEAEGVEMLVVGVELRSTERAFERRWRRLIRKVRSKYRGKLVYSANWDDVPNVPWWDAVDYVGVQFYAPVATASDTRPERVRLAMTERLDTLEAVSRAVDRPVIFTEVGYRTTEDALVEPHSWPERASKPRIDPGTQALGYAVFTEAIRSRDWVEGVYWWKWFTDPNTTEEGPSGFSPRGKPAEAILRASFAGNCNAKNPVP